jgi:hypothetical protein
MHISTENLHFCAATAIDDYDNPLIMSATIQEGLALINVAFFQYNCFGKALSTLQEDFLQMTSNRQVLENPVRDLAMDSPPYKSPVMDALLAIYFPKASASSIVRSLRSSIKWEISGC